MIKLRVFRYCDYSQKGSFGEKMLVPIYFPICGSLEYSLDLDLMRINLALLISISILFIWNIPVLILAFVFF